MAKRYSGDIELRITCRPYVGWSGKRELFYFASVAAPGHRGNGILSPRECGIGKGIDRRSTEAYDAAARAFIALAHREMGIGRFAEFDGDELVILRVQQAPCPVGMAGSVERKKRSGAKRARRTGRYTYSDLEKICVCGRRLGQHEAEAPHGMEDESCARFRPRISR